MFGKIQEAQRKMEESKQRLENITIEGEAEGGLVKATVTGSRKIKNLEISETLVKEGNKEQLEELVLTAINKAMEQADKLSAAEMQAIAKDMLPGGLGALGNLFGK